METTINIVIFNMEDDHNIVVEADHIYQNSQEYKITKFSEPLDACEKLSKDQNGLFLSYPDLLNHLKI